MVDERAEKSGGAVSADATGLWTAAELAARVAVLVVGDAYCLLPPAPPAPVSVSFFGVRLPPPPPSALDSAVVPPVARLLRSILIVGCKEEEEEDDDGTGTGPVDRLPCGEADVAGSLRFE